MATDNIFQRVLEIDVTCDESADTAVVTDVTYKRDGANGTEFKPKFTASPAAATAEVELGEHLPAPTIIKIITAFQA